MEKYKRVSEMTLEEKRRKIAMLTVVDGEFFQIMEDKKICEQMLQGILEAFDLHVIECIPQASMKNVIEKSVVFGVLCKGKDGNYYNLEIEKADDDDHQKRVRHKGAFDDLPHELYVVYLEKIDRDGLSSERADMKKSR